MSKSILFITEGREDEPRLIRRICKIYSGFREHEICYYNTSLYELMEAIYKGDRAPKDCNLLDVFKESKTATKKELLDNSYTDIYMIFDLDPHYQLYDKWKDKLPEMLEWYSESSLYGKLYINYPMMQSYMHIDDLDSDSFKDVVIDISDFNGTDYKKTTKSMCDQRIKAPAYIERHWMNRLLVLNIMKANNLRFDSWTVSGDLEKTLNSREIHVCEDEMMRQKGKLSVLNTSLFCILHQNDYSIPSDEDE